MNDRELLELAANASGMVGGWGEIFDIGGDKVDLTDMWFIEPESAIWDPLTDDGDALRLAVKLSLFGLPEFNHYLSIERFAGQAQDDCYAYRRAIVRAAAEIGRVMS